MKWKIVHMVGHFARGVFNGRWVSHDITRKQSIWFFPLVIIAAIYICTGFLYLKNERHQRELTKEIEDLNYEYIAVKTKLTQMKRGSAVEDSVKNDMMELERPKTASYIIKN